MGWGREGRKVREKKEEENLHCHAPTKSAFAVFDHKVAPFELSPPSK